MKILLATATNIEMKAIMDIFQLPENKHLITKKIYYGSIELSLLVSGIGPTAMACRTAKMLSQESYDLLINTGIAGAYSTAIKKGSMVHVTEEYFSDLGIVHDKNPITPIVEAVPQEYAHPYTDGKLINLHPFDNALIRSLPKVRGSTVHTVPTRYYPHHYAPEVETMEGAGFFYCCLLHEVPFVQLRAISNYTFEKRDTWDIPLALQQMTAFFTIFFTELEKKQPPCD